MRRYGKQISLFAMCCLDPITDSLPLQGTGKTCICLATILETKYMRIPSHNLGIQTDLVQRNQCSSLRDIAIKQMLRNGDWRRNQLSLPDHLIKIIKENPAYYERVENPMPLMIDRPRRVNVLQKMLKVYMAPTTLVVGKYTMV